MRSNTKELILWISAGITVIALSVFTVMLLPKGQDIVFSEKKTEVVNTQPTDVPQIMEFVVNEASKKIHISTCSQVKRIDEENKTLFTGNIDDEKMTDLLGHGYSFCGICGKKFAEKR